VQELATAVLDQLRRLPAASVDPSGEATGPTVRMIASIAESLTRRVDCGEISVEQPDEVLQRLRGLQNPNAIRERLRNAGWQGARRKLLRATPTGEE